MIRGIFLIQNLLKNEVKLITRIKKNMQNQMMILREKILLKKRSLIESVFNRPIAKRILR